MNMTFLISVKIVVVNIVFCLMSAEDDAIVLTREADFSIIQPLWKVSLNALAPDSQDALLICATALSLYAGAAFSSEVPTDKDWYSSPVP